MESKIPEFHEYIFMLSEALDISSESSEGICEEIRMNLYDKYNEYLIRGYGLENSVKYTIKTFENPVKLAKMFSKIYKEENIVADINRLIYNKKIIIGNFCIVFLMMVYQFIFSVYNFILVAGKDYGSLGWHAIDSNLISSMLLSITLLVLYAGSLYNIIFKKLLPPKIIIWVAYINFVLVLLFAVATK